ncbi:MAG: hypothetical protein KDA74_13050 [Planctomycetaceae bacterium]|nr:hypothetical protein [Planctomycetaceae bacterium]
MKSQHFQFYNKSQIETLTVDTPPQPMVPDWFTYLVTVSTSDAFPKHCAVAIMAMRDTPKTLVANKLVKGTEDDGLAWAASHLINDVHPEYHVEYSISKEL